MSSNNVSAAVLNGQANADVGVDIAVDKPAPLVGENVTFTVTVAEQRPEPRDRSRRHRCAVRGAHAGVGHALAGHVRGAGLDHRHAERDRPPVTLTIVATVTAPGPAGQCRDHHAADGSGFESGQQPRERDAQRGRVRQSQGDQVAHALVAARRGTADVQRDRGQPGPESGDGRRRSRRCCRPGSRSSRRPRRRARTTRRRASGRSDRSRTPAARG